MLKINRKTRHAILILSECARRSRSRVQTADVARAAGTTTVNARAIVHQLMRGRLLRTRQGRSGGIELARPAVEISLGDVLRVTDRAAAEGVLSLENELDVVSAAFAGAASHFIRTLDAITIADFSQMPGPCMKNGKHLSSCPVLVTRRPSIAALIAQS